MELLANPMTVQPMDVRSDAQLQPAYEVIEKAIATRRFRARRWLWPIAESFSACIREMSYDAKAAATMPTTMYDIASLTKVVRRHAGGEIDGGDFAVPLDLDAKIERYLPEWASGPNAEWRHRVTVRHLLTHTSGLPPFKEYGGRRRTSRTR